MLARSTAAATLALRSFVFAALLVGPVGALALQRSGPAAGIEGVGLVLFVSLQHAR